VKLSYLRDMILETRADDKNELPFLKFARFGNKRSELNSLRNNANVEIIHGVELDYDEGKISFEEAIKIAKKAKINSLLYTTSSYTKDVPAWRILCPTSCELPPQERLKLVKRVNGLYGGNFCGASFTLSQSFYFGGVRGKPKPRAVIVEGDYVDLRDDLDAGAMDKHQGSGGNDRPRNFDEALALLGDGPGLRGFRDPLRSAICFYVITHGANFDRDALKAKLREASNKAPSDKPRAYLDDDKNIDAMIDSAIKKYGYGDEDIRRLNAVHAVLPIGGKTKVVTFGELAEFPGRKTIVMTQSFGDFAQLHNKYRHEYVDPKGVPQSIPMGTHWLSSKHRRQYSGGMAFMPQHAEDVVGDKLNLWNGYGVQPIEGDCSLFLDFACEVICSGNTEHYDYLMKREAFTLQFRQRSEIALGLQSEEEGVGKGIYEKTMRHLYGNHAMHITNPAHIIGKFNPHLETLLRITADEALFVGDPRHRNALFGLITEPTIPIEPKFAGTITTNAKHFFMASGSARRIFIPTVSPCHKQDFKYFAAILEQLRNGGYEALLYHLLHLDISDFNVRDVPKTAGLAEQASLSRKGVDALVEEVCNTGVPPASGQREWKGFTETARAKDSGLAYELSKTTDPELKHMSPLVVANRLCKDWGCKSVRKRYGTNNEQRTYGLQWPSLEELRKRFEDRFGPQEWQHPEVTEWES
jgi:hypothetical protein